MPDQLCQHFQSSVANYLVLHQSILDIVSKINECSAKTTRATMKAVTRCGCIEIHAQKKPIPPDASLDDILEVMESDIDGVLCEKCRAKIQEELGETLFYITALCNALDMDLDQVIQKELTKLETLGIFNMA